MAISKQVHSELFAPLPATVCNRVPNATKSTESDCPAEENTGSNRGKPWTAEEHERFLKGVQQFPRGPWKAVSAFVGTRSERQTISHAQKYRQKLNRHRMRLHSLQKMSATRGAIRHTEPATSKLDDLSISSQTHSVLGTPAHASRLFMYATPESSSFQAPTDNARTSGKARSAAEMTFAGILACVDPGVPRYGCQKCCCGRSSVQFGNSTSSCPSLSQPYQTPDARMWRAADSSERRMVSWSY